MLAHFRAWLESELKLLGNASHHAYSFGQAKMAKRAIEQLDEELANVVVVELSKDDANAIATELAALETAGGPLPRGLQRLSVALDEMVPPQGPPAEQNA
jgi:hypothetical protein